VDELTHANRRFAVAHAPRSFDDFGSMSVLHESGDLLRQPLRTPPSPPRVSAHSRMPRVRCRRCGRWPTSMAALQPDCIQEKDAADHDAVFEHVEVVIAPSPRLARSRFAFRCTVRRRRPSSRLAWSEALDRCRSAVLKASCSGACVSIEVANRIDGLTHPPGCAADRPADMRCARAPGNRAIL
jgi:hypothetical protein